LDSDRLKQSAADFSDNGNSMPTPLMNQVVLVNESDETVGVMEKMDAHRTGVLHRAFSLFVINSSGEMLLQQRAFSKYHSGGLWTNTCCSHPYPNEEVSHAVHRRLQEEMGFDCPIEKFGTLLYKAEVGNGLTEHEYDHLFVGYYDKAPVANAEEVADWKYITLPELQLQLTLNPHNYTAWLRMAFPIFLDKCGGYPFSALTEK
jgi:isopentenyl-diphosphate Delta-isomerase